MFDDTDFRNGWVDADEDDWEDEVIYGRARNQRPARGQQRRSDAVWAQAKDDYLSGCSAEAVCARYDLKLGTFRSRSAREKWRRCDQADPEPAAWDEAEAAEDLAAAALPDYAAMARAALVRADRAIRAGRDLEAGRWLRMHERLQRLITDYDHRLAGWRRQQDEAPAAAPAPGPAPRPDQAVAALARAVHTALTDAGDDPAAYAALDTQLTALEAALVSDESDESDSVFSGAGSGVEPPAETPRPRSD